MGLEARCVTSRQGLSPWSWVLMWTLANQSLSPPGSSTSPSGAIPNVNTHKCQSCCCAWAVIRLPQVILGTSAESTFNDITVMAMIAPTANALVHDCMEPYIV